MKSVQWKLHLATPTEKVFWFLTDPEGLKKYWAEDVKAEPGFILFYFMNDISYKSRILSLLPNEIFEFDYFTTHVRFVLANDGNGGTDLTMTCSNIPEHDFLDMHAGWLSVLLNLKAVVDFGADLRNHDAERTWFQGYVDN